MKSPKSVVWITGASSGIGEALAKEYARRGCVLVLSARRSKELERVRENLVNHDAHAIVVLDLADEQSILAAVNEVKARFGSVDLLIHNGGVSQRSLVESTPLAVDRQIMEVNFFGTVALTKAVLPWFQQAGTGRFVVITSLVGELPTPLRSAYSASKHALHGFFESLRAETYEAGVRVTLVMPGFIATNVSLNALTADGSAQGTMDDAQRKGMSADRCAFKIAEAVQKGRDQVIIAGREGVGVYLKRWFPALYRRLIRNMKVT